MSCFKKDTDRLVLPRRVAGVAEAVEDPGTGVDRLGPRHRQRLAAALREGEGWVPGGWMLTAGGSLGGRSLVRIGTCSDCS